MHKIFLNIFLFFLFSTNYVLAGIIFDGEDDSVNCGGDSSMQVQNFSFSFWANPILEAGNSGPLSWTNYGSKQGWGLYCLSNNVNIYWVGNGTNNKTITAFTMTEGWSHYAITRSSNIFTSYMNGTIITSNSTTLNRDPPTVYAGTFNIGLSLNSSYNFNGGITECYLWDKALTATEIRLLFTPRIKGIGLQVQPDNLKAYWPMDDRLSETSADGYNVKDVTENANNGTGVDGANNTGLQWVGESVLSYPPQ